MQRLRTLSVAVVGVVCLSACQPAQSSTPVKSVSVSPSPSPSSSSPDAEQQQLVAASNRVIEMWAVIDQLAADPTKPINDLDEYAGGEWVEQQRDRIARYRAAGVTTTGQSVITILASERVGKDVIVQACADVSKLVVKDRDGKVINGPPYRILHKSTVRQVGAWLRIVKDEGVTEC